MRKLILLKDDEISVRKEYTIYCDFCGDHEKDVFTSSYGDEVQVCYDCVRQLHKHLP